MSTPRPPCAPSDLEARVRQLLAAPQSKGCYLLHCFHAVGTGSFHAARGRLGVRETSSVRKRVVALGKLLKTKLFISDAGGHRNTADGRTVLDILARCLPGHVSDAPPDKHR